jgi:isopenicillin N synthase-like dioxygenase
MTALTVPTIDMSGWATSDHEARREIARSVNEAASTVGFMQIVGHGIPGRFPPGPANP